MQKQSKIPPTMSELMELYIELRDTVADLNRRHDDELRPYFEGMEDIEKVISEEITRLDGRSIGSEKAIAFRQVTTKFTVADRETWLDWVMDNNERNMLTTNVSREAVKEWVESNGGTLPPGLQTNQVAKIIIRSRSE